MTVAELRVEAPTDAQCRDCHARITAEDAAARRLLASSLSDSEYAGLIQAGGEDVMRRLFGV